MVFLAAELLELVAEVVRDDPVEVIELADVVGEDAFDVVVAAEVVER